MRLRQAMGASAIAVAGGVLLLGCDRVNSVLDEHVSRAVSREVEQQLAALRSRLDAAETTIQENETSCKIRFRLLGHELDLLKSQAASVSTEDSAYAITRNRHGSFPVSVKSIAPHLDGYKVKLAVGNTSTAVFSGADVTVGWGIPYGTEGYSDEEIKASQRKKEVAITDRFSPGEYTTFEVVVSPAKATEVKTLDVGITFDQMALRR